MLHERNFGALRGRAYDTLGFDPLAMDDAPPGGESAQAFAERIAAPSPKCGSASAWTVTWWSSRTAC